MLDALALATIFAFGPKSEPTSAQALPLKSKLIDSLSIGSNCSNDTRSADQDPRADINSVKDRLCTFAEECVGKPGALSHLLNPGVNFVAAMPDRRKLVAKFLSEQERLSLARLLVKDVDRYTYKMHCQSASCGEGDNTCEFRIITCPNKNCNATFSCKHSNRHDEECEFKLIPCPSGCGTLVERKVVHTHVRDHCSLRQAECPLSTFGCTAVVQAQDISTHLNSHADKHFMLMATRMKEYQDVFKEMNARMTQLEAKNNQLERELKRVMLQSQNRSEADVKKLSKRIGTLENTC